MPSLRGRAGQPQADLIAANLEGAVLSGANLREADLLGATLTSAVYAPEDLIVQGHPRSALCSDSLRFVVYRDGGPSL
jgi:hypothetical protein